jgi:MFS family permease
MIKKHILPSIVIAQFCCTSLWFAGNGVINELVINFSLNESAMSHLTSTIQFGFITGTLLFALMTIADRFSPSKVFFVCALLGATFNLGVIWSGNTLISLLILRFITGFFLAGIYPVGMKIAADYYDKGLGKSLGYLVGALVVGTALPHLLNGLGQQIISWNFVLIGTSGIAVVGGAILLFFVPDGPHRKPSQQLDLTAFFKVFQNKSFRAASFGYFGHMWELYTFWAFVPFMISTYNSIHENNVINIAILAFFVIGIGGLACVIGGYLSLKFGSRKIAFIALFLSMCCCLISPIVFNITSPSLFIAFLLFWGMVVIADSPLFSTLVANNADAKLKGTALTIVNCIGFAITIVSIQLINALTGYLNDQMLFLILAAGPIFGLISLARK